MEKLMKVSSNPHVRSKETTSSIMMTVVIALLPAAGFGIYNFGVRALLHMIVCIAAAVLSEFAFEKICKQKVTINDFSAVVTGLLLALNLPVSAPLWMGALGICHRGCQDAVRRHWTELYEPGAGRTVFSAPVFPEADDHLCL